MKKKILLVGGTSALGTAILREAVQRQHAIVATTTQIAQIDNKSFIAMNVLSEDSVQTGVRQALELLGGLDTIIYAPAISKDSLMHTSQLADWQVVFDVNLMGAVRLFKATIPYFLKEKNGVYQFISSTASTQAVRGAGSYACSKAALDAFSRNIALEYGSFNIRSYTIRPGCVNGGMLSHLEENEKSSMSRQIAMKRFAEVNEIGHFSISTLESSSYLSGTELTLHGGGPT